MATNTLHITLRAGAALAAAALVAAAACVSGGEAAATSTDTSGRSDAFASPPASTGRRRVRAEP